MSFVFAPNRDAGSVSRHRNPDTRRRQRATNVGCGWSCTRCNPVDAPRASMKIELKKQLDVLVLIDDEIEEDYPPIPDEVWDEMYYAYVRPMYQ